MPSFPVHHLDNAPEPSRAVLAQIHTAFGFVPNVAGVIAGSPPLLKGFWAVFQSVHAGSFSEAQIQVVLLTNAVTNACRWAVAFHTHLALHNGVTAEDVQAIREGRAPREAPALWALARGLIERRGHVDTATEQAFLDAGFRDDQILELVQVSAASTMTNYVATLGHPPLEAAFQRHAWQPA